MPQDDTKATAGPTEQALARVAQAIDTSNKFAIAGSTNGTLVAMAPLPRMFSKQDALLLAAYLVAMVGDDELWQQTLDAVQNT